MLRLTSIPHQRPDRRERIVSQRLRHKRSVRVVAPVALRVLDGSGLPDWASLARPCQCSVNVELPPLFEQLRKHLLAVLRASNIAARLLLSVGVDSRGMRCRSRAYAGVPETTRYGTG